MAFSFGGSTGADTGASFSFASLGSTPAAGGGFGFGAPAATTTAPAAGGFAFGAPTTTAPATTGFSFATSTAPSATTTAPSLFSLSTPATTTTTTTAPATTGFNFSSFSTDTTATTTTAPATTTTTAPTTSLFGFGDTGASTSTSALGPSFSLASTSSSLTTAPTATTSEIGGFNFAAPTTTATSTTAASTTATTTSTTASTTSTIDPSSRIKNKTVDEILNTWSRDLEDHVQSFTEQAIEVKKWDHQMIENLNKIVRLQHSVTNVQASQVKLNRILETIKINQQDLTTMMDDLEKAVDQSSKRHLTPDEMKREEAYRLAEEIDSQLMVMSDSLQETVRTLNTSAERHADPNNPFHQIVKILNVQMTSLQWIEQTSQQLETQLQQAQHVVRNAKADTRTTSNGVPRVR